MINTDNSLKSRPPWSLMGWLREKRLQWFPQPPAGKASFGALHRKHPISRRFGIDRGQCIDRYYIEQFLESYREAVRGRVLEIADREYTERFGGGRVTRSDVLHFKEGNPKATLVADLARGENLPSESFDCVILTQTLQHIYEVGSAVQTLQRILKPGGVILATFPGISQISRYDMDRWGDYWRFTTLSAQRLFGEAFGTGNIKVTAYGNVLAAMAFLQGLAAHELKREELDYIDPDYQLVVTVRATKDGSH